MCRWFSPLRPAREKLMSHLPPRSQEQLIVPMSTPLGTEHELVPEDGPPVPVFDESEGPDERPTFASLSLYIAGQMPSEEAMNEYVTFSLPLTP